MENIFEPNNNCALVANSDENKVSPFKCIIKFNNLYILDRKHFARPNTAA